MLGYWIKRLRLRLELAALVREGEQEAAERERRPSRIAGPLVLYGLLEYERLAKKAHRLGLDPNEFTDGREGYDVDEDGRLSGHGYTKLRKAIRDERLNLIEKLVKIFAPLIAAFAALIGVYFTLVKR